MFPVSVYHCKRRKGKKDALVWPLVHLLSPKGEGTVILGDDGVI